MPSTRHPTVAGLFYPGNATQLQTDVQAMLAAAKQQIATPKALIVPHAGYVYSGSVAASAYAQLAGIGNKIHRVILLGPAHRVALRGIATSSADYFETPLGKIPLDIEAIQKALQCTQVQEFDLTHEQEHSLEVQLPFLQTLLSEFTLVPLVVGDSNADEVSTVLEKLWGGEETLIVISSDLSHYNDYTTAQTMDQTTCHAIEHLDYKTIDYHHACGRNPVLGILQSANRHKMKVTTLDLRNSGDTAGSKDKVVGYGAWMFEETI